MFKKPECKCHECRVHKVIRSTRPAGLRTTLGAAVEGSPRLISLQSSAGIVTSVVLCAAPCSIEFSSLGSSIFDANFEIITCYDPLAAPAASLFDLQAWQLPLVLCQSSPTRKWHGGQDCIDGCNLGTRPLVEAATFTFEPAANYARPLSALKCIKQSPYPQTKCQSLDGVSVDLVAGQRNLYALGGSATTRGILLFGTGDHPAGWEVFPAHNFPGCSRTMGGNLATRWQRQQSKHFWPGKLAFPARPTAQ